MIITAYISNNIEPIIWGLYYASAIIKVAYIWTIR